MTKECGSQSPEAFSAAAPQDDRSPIERPPCMIDITSAGLDELVNAMGLCSPICAHVTGYKVLPRHGLVLYHGAEHTGCRLPFKMSLAKAGHFAYEWLQQLEQERRAQAPVPQLPPSTTAPAISWRLYTGLRGQILDDPCSFAAVQPVTPIAQ